MMVDPPSTIIRITPDDINRLNKIVNIHENYIPSDIIEANIIPIHSLAIDFDVREQFGRILRFDVVALDAEEKRSSNDALMVIPYIHGRIAESGATLIRINDGRLQAFWDSRIWEDEAKDFHFALISNIIVGWYCIQVALLHPTIKEVFRRSGIMSDKDREEIKDYKKRPLFYQKVKTINQREFDDAVKRSINRKTLIWYVIGHWRNYKDGRRIFIQPYWKGALRETKMTEVPRERVI